jgi:LacI family transcriptional regulator/LacI family purine nucleotide synthesis repressor
MSDIAQRLGISTVSVSKALSNQKGVSDELREKIRETAEAMGYKPPYAEKAAKRSSYNIGVLVVEAYIEKYVTFYWEMYQKVSLEAMRMNAFVMLEIVSCSDELACNPPKLIQEDRVDGLMILGGMQSEFLQMLHECTNVPIVYMDFYDGKQQDDCVISNSFYGSYTVVNYLFEMGHRDIAFVGTPMVTDSITDRYLGYLKAMMEHGKGNVPAEWIIPDRDIHRVCYDEIQLPESMPTAFYCNCDLTAGKLIKSLLDKGYRVPEDISVAGYDDYIYPGLCDVEITTYSVDMDQMAKVGVHSLMKKIREDDCQEGHHIVEGRLVIKDSVGRIGRNFRRRQDPAGFSKE